MNPVDATGDLRAWIGRQQTEHDVVTAAPLRMMRATLDLPSPDAGADLLPPLWHWLFFVPSAPQSEIGDDGHARRGGFLPPVPLPRRMWAGGRFEFFDPPRVGDALTRVSTIEDVNLKTGRSGALCFVRVRHDIASPRGPALREWHDIVYRPAPRPDAPAAPEKAAADSRHEPAPATVWSQRIVPSDVLLFRYSALTFNGHRIHYDRRYVTETEGYPGLVVHGPLLATLLAGLATRHGPARQPLGFVFRALKPVFDLHPFDVCGAPESGADDTRASLWVRDHAGHVALRATMTFAA